MSKEIVAVKNEDLPDTFLEENRIKEEEENSIKEEEEEERKKKKRKKSPSDDAEQDETPKPRYKLCKLNNANNRCQTYSFKKCYS